MFKFVATCHLQCMYLVHDVRLITPRSLKLSAGKAGNLLKCWRQSFLKDSAKRIVFRPKSQKHAQRDGRWWGSVSRANGGWSLLLAKEPLHYTTVWMFAISETSVGPRTSDYIVTMEVLWGFDTLECQHSHNVCARGRKKSHCSVLEISRVEGERLRRYVVRTCLYPMSFVRYC